MVCALIFGPAQYWDICLQELGIVTWRQQRIRVHLCDRQTQRRARTCAWLRWLPGRHLGSTVTIGRRVSLCRPCHVCSHPFVCKSNSAYLTSHNKNFTGTFCKATLPVTFNKLTQLCPKSQHQFGNQTSTMPTQKSQSSWNHRV